MVLRSLFLFLLLILQTGASTAQDEHDAFLSKTFKKVIKLDQSNIRNNKVRDSLIKDNFALIQELLEDSVNLNTNQSLKRKTSGRLKTGLVITFIHILQIEPTMLLNEETSDFFARHIAEERISSEELKSALSVYQVDVDNKRWPEERMNYFKERVDSIKEKWQIKD